jgi:hypothetical protein
MRSVKSKTRGAVVKAGRKASAETVPAPQGTAPATPTGSREKIWILVLDIDEKSVDGPYEPDELTPEERARAHTRPQIRLKKKGRQYITEFEGNIPERVRDFAESAWIGHKDPEMVERFVRAALRMDSEEPIETNPFEEWFEPESTPLPEPDYDPEYFEGGW